MGWPSSRTRSSSPGRAAVGRRGELVATLSPGVVLSAWYLLANRGGTGITLYPSWREKAIALTETLQFFLRSDPFPPPLPLFWINVSLALAFVGIVLARLDVRAIGTAVATRPVLWVSVALAAVALLLPISTVNDLIKPDERFVAPALLLAIAALPYRRGRLRLTVLGPALAAAVVALHLVEYVDVGQRIAQVDAATDAAGSPCTPSHRSPGPPRSPAAGRLPRRAAARQPPSPRSAPRGRTAPRCWRRTGAVDSPRRRSRTAWQRRRHRRSHRRR